VPLAATAADNGIRVGLISSETYRTGTVLIGVKGLCGKTWGGVHG
jgi:hypothetical protein